MKPNTALKKFLTCICLIFIVMTGGLLILRTIHAADYEGAFVDEIVNSQAAYAFFTEGNYTSIAIGGRFHPGITTGIATTWISGLAWLLGGNLFAVRLALSLVIYVQVLLLSVVIIKKREGSLLQAWAMAVVLIAVLTRWIPYCWGFIRNLGELQGALFVAWSLIFIRERPYWAFLCLGASVWGCKFIYFPVAVCILVVYGLTFSGLFFKKALHLFLCLLLFFLPLLTWVLIISVVYDQAEGIAWLRGFYGYVTSGNSGLKENTHFTFWGRLQDPQLEWNTMPAKFRKRILFFLFCPTIYLIGLFVMRIFTFRFQLKPLLILGLWGCLCFYYAWYFIMSPTMWVRHIQPGIYLSVGIVTFFILESILWARARGSARLTQAGLILMLIIFTGIETSKAYKIFPVMNPKSSYARECADLYSEKCIK